MEKTSLAKISSIVKNPLFLLLMLFITIGILLTIGFSLNSFKKAPFIWNGLVPGQSTKENILNNLGKPEEEKTEEGKTILKYPTTNNYRQNSLDIQNDKLSVVKEEVIGNEKGRLQDYVTKYGQPEFVGYGPYADQYFKTFVFSNKGVAIVANPIDGVIIQIWYFQPTSVESFRSAIGKDISDKPPVDVR